MLFAWEVRSDTITLYDKKIIQDLLVFVLFPAKNANNFRKASKEIIFLALHVLNCQAYKYKGYWNSYIVVSN